MSENALDAFNRRMRERDHITEEDSKREIERQKHYAAHNRASALAHAADVEREKWQKVAAEKVAEIARLDAEIARLDAEIARLDMEIAKRAAEIARRQAELDKRLATDKC